MASKPKFVPHLVVIEGQDKGKVISLEEGTVIIGRSKGDIIIQDARLSRSHVAIEFDKKTGKVTFTDLKSLNGTFLNEEPVQTGEIKDGDQLRVGETIFDCQMEESAPKELHKKRKEPELPKEKEPVLEGKKTSASPRKEKEKVAASAKSRPKRESSYTKIIRTWYGKVPPRRRTQMLAGILVIFGCYYLLSGGTPDSAELYAKIQEVRALVKAGDMAGGERAAEALKEKYPDAGPVYILLGDLSLQRGEESTALELYKKASSLPPVDPILHVHLMEIYLRFNLQASTDEDRNHWKEQMRGEFAKVAEAIGEAGKSLSTAITQENIKPVDFVKQNPAVRDLFVGTAELFLRFKELDEPVEQMILVGRALQRDIAPDSPVGFKLEAQVQLKLNQLAQAVAALEGAMNLDQNDLWVIENLALAKYRLKDYAGAETVFKKWIGVSPDSAKAYLVMAYLKISQKDAVGAVPYLQKVIEIGTRNPKDPYYPEALYVVGQVMLQADRKSDALQYVTESCRLGYQAGCQSPLLEGRIPTSPATRAPQSLKKSDVKPKKK